MSSPQQNDEVDTAPAGGYPEQRHAGAVGLGPEYGKGASGGDKIAGWKEEIVGKILRNPEKVQHRKEVRTGELKKREQEEEDEKENPFKKEEKEKKEPEGGKDAVDSDKQSPSGSANSQTHKPQTAATGPSIEANSRSDPEAAKEQAATTAPEGTEAAESQRKGETTRKDKQIG